MAPKLVKFCTHIQILAGYNSVFSPIPEPGTRSAIPLPKWEQQVCVMVDKFLQSNKPTGRLGEARQSGNSAVAAELAVLSRCASIFLITAESSILATIRTSPPHSLQVSISILKTRFKRFAQVIEARFSAGVWSVSPADWHFIRLPRLAGVTHARFLLFGAPKVGALGEHAMKAG